MSKPDLTRIINLPVDERIEAVTAIWDSIAKDSAAAAALPVPEWHLEILRERMARAKSGEEDGLPWPEVRRRLLEKKNKKDNLASRSPARSRRKS